MITRQMAFYKLISEALFINSSLKPYNIQNVLNSYTNKVAPTHIVKSHGVICKFRTTYS